MKASISKILSGAIVICMLTVYMSGCKKTEIATSTTSDVNIVGYLDKHLDSFSLFRQILERTENAAYLNAYGAYTIFAVTNSGVQAYLTSLGAASVDAADLNTLKNMVKLHLLQDTITTAAFTDGKLPVITMYGQYLITGVTQKYGKSNYLINRQGFVLQSNIKTGNGLIHVIDNVLKPATLSLAQQLEAKPEYSIFLQAVRETGYYNLLNTNNNPDVNKRFLTLIAESNEVLRDSGITSYAALRAKYAQNANLTDSSNKLNMYVAYHILYNVNFLADIIVSPSHITLAPQEVVTTKFINEQVVINQDEFNGVVETGVSLKKASSDVQTTNGVLHDAAAHFSVKFRTPTAVYWDVSNFEEIRRQTAFYKKQTLRFNKPTAADEPIKDITWPLPVLPGTSWLEYSFSTTTSITRYANNWDCTRLPLGLPNRPIYFDFKTPVIIKGQYKVWICYSRRLQSQNSPNHEHTISIDGEPMQRTMNFGTVRPTGTDAELEAINFKRYTENADQVMVGRLVGIVDIKTTERHTLRIANVRGSQEDNFLDMVHFIPVGQIQYLPRFKPNGDTLMR